MVRVANATQLYARCQLGWKPGMPLICVWGSQRDIGREYRLRSRIGSWLRRRHLVDGYRMDGQTVDRVLELIRRCRRPVAIYGFSSMLHFVAREVLSRGDLPPAGKVCAAWNGGEMLFPSQSEIFEQAFGVPILNLYGGRELGTMAFQAQWGASMCVARPFVYVDIVDDAGRPVPPGQAGRLIWTSTVGRGTPFLRYDIGDLGAADACDQDESGVYRLTSLCGRHAGLLTLPGGKTLSALFWNHLFKEFPEVVQFQVALVEDRGIELRLKGKPFSREREMDLRRILLNFMGPLPVNIVWMAAIPLTQQGKLLQVVREAA
jgi:phenylacetate-CoA ligase